MALAAATRVGPYEIVAPLGAGGMGQVWRAHDHRLGRDVAIKVLPPELAFDPERLQRFEREARATAALNHPNILAVHDVGTHDGAPFIVEELVEGESLRTLLGKGRLPIETVTELAAQLASGLAAAHDKSIVHRDLKPENVIVTRDGIVKILDFGLAKFVAAAPAASAATLTHVPTGATEPGAVLGTAAYMAPEQALGRSVDQRADVFAFGVVFYEMLAGVRPFRGDTGTEIVAAILKDAPPPLPEAVPAHLGDLVGRCLEKRPQERFASAREVLGALQAPPSDLRASAASRVGPRRPRLLRRTALVAAAALVAAVAAGLWLRNVWTGTGGAGMSLARVLVGRFENHTGDATLAPISAMIVESVTQGLVELGEIEVVPGPGGNSAVDDAALRAAARRAGAGTVVSGSYYLTGEELELRARLTDTASGKPVFVLNPERAPRSEPGRPVDRVRQRVMSAVMLRLERAPALGGITTPPLYSAYQEFLAGARSMGVDPQAVIAHLERAAATDPEFWHPQLRLMYWYQTVGDTAKLEALRNHVRDSQDKLGPTDTVLLQYYEALLAGRTLEAYRKARELLALAPRDFTYIFAAASLASNLNRPREALQCIGDLEKIDWKTFGTWMQGSWLLGVAALSHHLVGGYEAELAVAEMGMRLYPDLLNVRDDRVRALAALGRIVEMNAAITESLAIRSPGKTPGEVMLAAAQELRAHGHPDEARQMAARCEDWYAELTGDEADKPGTPLNRVECLWLAERWATARQLADQVAAARPTDLTAQGYRGILAAREGNHAVAEQVDRDLAAADDVRRRGRCSYLRACIAAQRGERDRAMELLRDAAAHGLRAAGSLHVYSFLEPLHGYTPFEELIKPVG